MATVLIPRLKISIQRIILKKDNNKKFHSNILEAGKFFNSRLPRLFVPRIIILLPRITCIFLDIHRTGIVRMFMKQRELQSERNKDQRLQVFTIFLHQLVPLLERYEGETNLRSTFFPEYRSSRASVRSRQKPNSQI